MRKKKGAPGVDYSKELKSDDLPATQGYLNAVRMELKADITTLCLEMKSGFAKYDGRFAQMESRFVQMESKFGAEMAQIKAMIAQMHANNEKQRNENRIVLDAISVMIERQDLVERKLEETLG